MSVLSRAVRLAGAMPMGSVCPILARFIEGLEEALDKENRSRLMDYVPQIIWTGDDGRAMQRVDAILFWLFHECVPAFAVAGGFSREANALRDTRLEIPFASDATGLLNKLERTAIDAGNSAVRQVVACVKGALNSRYRTTNFYPVGTTAGTIAGVAGRMLKREYYDDPAAQVAIEALYPSVFALLDRMV
jgi:hypothetical protein